MAAETKPSILTRQRVQKILCNDSTVVTSAEERLQLEDLTKQSSCSSSQSEEVQVVPSTSKEAKQEHLRQKLESDIWVQCENADCLKWRRLPKADGTVLHEDEPWYCWLAPGGASSCDTPEENHRHYDQLAHRCRIKYIVSALAPGTLVWATVKGYCKWPGLVTPDPVSGVHVERDHYGHTSGYHVEFLGSKRSRGWVGSCRIETYGAATTLRETKQEEEVKPSKCGGKRTKHGKRKANKNVVHQRMKYHGVNVHTAITEASSLLKVSLADRLRTCVFIPQCQDKPQHHDKPTGKTPHLHLTSKDLLHRVNKSNAPSAIRKPKKTSKMMPPSSSTATNRTPCPMNSSHTSIATCTTVKNIPGPSTTTKKKLMTSTVKVKTSLLTHVRNLAGLMSSNMAAADMQKKSIAGGVGGRNAMESCQTREEKYVRDIQSFQEDEALFENQLVAFMGERGEGSARPALWHGIYVTPLQLFLAVHEKGGYHKVCSSHQWCAIYEEVTSGIGAKGSSRGQLPKRYYQKNLLAYELYLRNGGSPGINYHGVDSMHEDSMMDCHDSRPGDIHRMLRQLDSMLEQCSFSYTDQRQQRELDRRNVVAFYDESPNAQTQDYRLADTASEFGMLAQYPCDTLYGAYEAKVREDVELFHEITAMQAEMESVDTMLGHLE